MFDNFNSLDWNYYLSSGSTNGLPEDQSRCAIILDDGTVKANLYFDLASGNFVHNGTGITTHASEVSDFLEY